MVTAQLQRPICPWQVFWKFFRSSDPFLDGFILWPFERVVGDLHLGDQKGHLEETLFDDFCLCEPKKIAV